MPDVNLLPGKWNLNETGLTVFSADAAQKSDLDRYVKIPGLEKKLGSLIARASRPDSGNFMHFIVGSVGRGKSISLFRIEQIIEDDYSTSVLPVRLEFVNTDDMNPRGFLFRILVRLVQAWPRKKVAPDLILRALQQLPTDYSEWRGLLRAIMLPQASQLMSTASLFPETFGGTSSELDNRLVAIRYLSGQPLTAQEYGVLGLRHRLNSTDSALSILTSLRIALRCVGYCGIVGLVDEFENLFSNISKTRRPQYVTLLRNLYDAGTPDGLSGADMASLGFFFGVSEGGMSELSALGEHESDAGPTAALKSRISSTTLVGFTLVQTRQLIEKRLQKGRSTAPDQSDPEAYIIPFTDDFVKYVHLVTMGWPRGIVQTCQDVLEAGLAEGVTLLDRNFAEKVRSDRA